MAENKTKQQQKRTTTNYRFRAKLHLSVFAASEPTFKQVRRLNEPRPSKVLAHWAPRIVLPSLYAIMVVVN